MSAANSIAVVEGSGTVPGTVIVPVPRLISMEPPLGLERSVPESVTGITAGAAPDETLNVTNAKPRVPPAGRVVPAPLFEISPAESQDPVLAPNGCKLTLSKKLTKNIYGASNIEKLASVKLMTEPAL